MAVSSTIQSPHQNHIEARVRKDGIQAHIRNSLPYRIAKQILSKTAWRVASPALSAEQSRIVKDLERDGISITSLRSIGLDQALLERLAGAAERLSKNRDVIVEGADPSNSDFRKNFWFKLLGHETIVADKPDVFAEVSLTPALIDMVNTHIGCYSWLMDYNLWLNLATQEAPKSSQMWHRDHVIFGKGGTYSPKIRRIIKVFIYLSDVTAENGALSYLPGSHEGGPLDGLEPPKAIVEDTLAARVSDSVMADHVSRTKWKTAEGTVGTVVLFDASGFHKGGHVTDGERLVFKAEYGNWMWMNALYPKVIVPTPEQFSPKASVRWAASLGRLFP